MTTIKQILTDIHMAHDWATLDAAGVARDQLQTGETSAENRALDAALDAAMVRIAATYDTGGRT